MAAKVDTGSGPSHLIGLRWLRLRRNHGTQAGPNALGWRSARAPVIAYLGHDDLWHPDHLLHLLAALADDVDVAHATTLVLGHPSGADMVAGRRVWRRGTFVPPSSIAHRRDGDRVGRWPRSAGGSLPVDYDFLVRAADAGARFAAAGQPTVFKYPSTWGLDSYRIRDVSRQRRLADLLAQDPQIGRRMEAAALEAGADGVVRFDALSAAPGEIADHNLRQRGLSARFGTPRRRWRAEATFDDPGWYPAEVDAGGRHHRWTGAAERASVRLDPPRGPAVAVRIEIAHVLTDEQLDGLVVDIDGVLLKTVTRRRADGTHTVEGRAWRRPRRRPLEVGLRAPPVHPSEVDPASRDDRMLGVAVRSISIR